MSKIFEHDYQTLELSRDAGWIEARQSYRRLVNRWHPDRFASRPREKHLAQSRFIEVTKAYNNLRAFHREHNRLPLQGPKQSTNPQQSSTSSNPRTKGRKTTASRLKTEDENLFTTESPHRKPTKKPYWLFAIPAVAIIAILALFIVLEKRIAQQQRQNAIEVLRSVEPSEFMPRR